MGKLLPSSLVAFLGAWDQGDLEAVSLPSGELLALETECWTVQETEPQWKWQSNRVRWSAELSCVLPQTDEHKPIWMHAEEREEMSKVSMTWWCCLLIAARALGGEGDPEVLILSDHGQTFFPTV